MGVKNSGYSIVNFLMDLVMVMSIVVFLNVSLKLAPENEVLSMISSPKSPISEVYDKMYSSKTTKQKVAMSSSSSNNAIRVRIGGEDEEEKKLPSSSVPSFIRSAVFDVAMKNKMLAENTSIETMDIPEVIRNTATIKTYINGEEASYVKPNGFVHNDAYPYDITLTTIVPISRIGNILKLTSWSGPVNVCVYANTYREDREKIMDFTRHEELSGKVTLIVVYSDFYDIVYPINTLKNIAISTVFTTHFIMIDDTMIPSDLLYDKLRKIPVSVLYEPINLVTIPVFFGEDDIAVRKDIRDCIKSKKCYPKYINMNPEWFEDDHKSFYMKLLKCIDPNTVYYFMRRHNSFDVLYDEQILTRGYDDISLIQNLLTDGYVLHLLYDGYFIDTSMMLDIENRALQGVESIHSQFNHYMKNVAPNKDVMINVCTEKETVAEVLTPYDRAVQLDKEARSSEIKTLRDQFNSMSSKLYDVMAWNRKIARASAAREKRIKNSI